ncbi:hypothetical protein AQ862_27635 [Burkholderia pseudomallei]|nr:hypothetical protein AQ862_27635 [Burkholderia pseudomallei]
MLVGELRAVILHLLQHGLVRIAVRDVVCTMHKRALRCGKAVLLLGRLIFLKLLEFLRFAFVQLTVVKLIVRRRACTRERPR